MSDLVEMQKNPVMARQEAQVAFEKANLALELGKNWLNKSYVSSLPSCQIMPANDDVASFLAGKVRIFSVERICVENKQSMLESLTAIYHSIYLMGGTVFLFLDHKAGETVLYLGVKNDKLGNIASLSNLIESNFAGHFAGSELKMLDSDKSRDLLEGLRPNSLRTVSALTAVPSLAVQEREHFMQGLEHFIDVAGQEDYQALILAEPVSSFALDEAQQQYENFATSLSPLLKQQHSFNDTSSQNIGVSISEGITESLTQTETTGTTSSLSEGNSVTEGTSDSESRSHTVGGSMNSSINIKIINANVSTNYSHTRGSTHTVTHSETQSITKTTGTTSSSAVGKTKGKTDTLGRNFGTSESQGRTISFDSVDKNIEQITKLIDIHLDRIREARSYGGWTTSAYFITKEAYQSRSLASMFLALMRGENSHSEAVGISTWTGESAKSVLEWLHNLSHPQLQSPDYGNFLTPATLVSGKEMAIQLSLPRRSTSTVSVVEAQAFGRCIQNVNGEEKAEKSIYLGEIRHLWQKTQQKVNLDLQKLASHVFVSGSTGSGKSNTVYQILSELRKNEVKFMVIEPAKGEYKNVFGHFSDVNVFGTNPTQAALLKINPFKFPQGVHVLEHIDRLIEIFNVCWPMYAAMPAILKEAMLEAYKTSGWNLEDSYNRYSDQIFPTFADLLTQLEQVIAKSAYAEEMKSNYIGSLVTRVKSLTNGLNGQIFSSAEIDNSVLFDQNVIVDLSRVGSQETKSLIMGILVMRLSEYRMSSNQMNQPLKHVTVLEEAHNILKRTSTEQSSEGANVAGKAVEMLSNAIAEMRTYGEGFIIADQSPNAVDISAIRNTNTKIIMRLPDEADRRLAGKSSGATDEQIEEIAKLPKGVAVVYQNDWLEPILCQIKRFETDEKPYIYVPQARISEERKRFNLHLARLLLRNKMAQIENVDFAILKAGITKFDLPANCKKVLLQIIANNENNPSKEIIFNSVVDVTNLCLQVIGIPFDELLDKLKSDNLANVLSFVDKSIADHLENVSSHLLNVFKQETQIAWKQYH